MSRTKPVILTLCVNPTAQRMLSDRIGSTVYFGTDDPRNVQALPLVPADPPNTNNRVHLLAIKEGIDRSLQLTKRKTVVIMTTITYAPRKRTLTLTFVTEPTSLSGLLTCKMTVKTICLYTNS